MRSILLSLTIILTGLSSFSQGSQQLYDAFPPMPSSVSNDDLIQIKRGNALDSELAAALNQYTIAGNYFAIGKIETKKSVILIYGSCRELDEDKDENPAMTGVVNTFDKKTGEAVAGGLQHYLFMVGEDAMRRESSIAFDGSRIVFHMDSFDLESGRKKESESNAFAVGKEKLEME